VQGKALDPQLTKALVGHLLDRQGCPRKQLNSLIVGSYTRLGIRCKKSALQCNYFCT
jgi:hypothetical protein